MKILATLSTLAGTTLGLILARNPIKTPTVSLHEVPSEFFFLVVACFAAAIGAFCAWTVCARACSDKPKQMKRPGIEAYIEPMLAGNGARYAIDSPLFSDISEG